jgi:dTDP-4-dehydrorhamnose 3,5-epimerase
MKFIPTGIAGAFLLELELIEDERGFFARSWCRDEFASQGLNPSLAQCNVSFSRRKGTLRGMHYQVLPHQEAKLVRCTMGRVFDVIADLRGGSPNSPKWRGFELSAKNRHMLFIPEDVAHGFITLEDNTEVLYQMSDIFDPICARGFRWDDPAFGIDWPISPKVMSDRDRSYPDFTS